MTVQTELLRFSTAGSVDDGKSTLIGRLLFDAKSIFEDQLSNLERTTKKRGGQGLDLALLTDGLIAEREQGITIDVAYRYFATPKRKFIIADTPGHEQYTRNMVTGASTAQLAIVLVDARKGLLAQSRRHAIIAHLLGIPHLLVAVNKMDLVNYSEEVLQRVRRDFRTFAAKLNIPHVHFVPISALHGDMVVDRSDNLAWYKGPTLLDLLETVDLPQTLADAPFRLPVQLVARPTAGLTRGYMGRIESGSIAVRDEVTVLPSGIRSRVRRIGTHEGARQQAGLHASVTLALEQEVDVSRGDMLVRTGAAPTVTRTLDATVCWLSETPLDARRSYTLRHATREVARASKASTTSGM